MKTVRALVESRRNIFAFWHSRILLLSYIHKGLGATILVSKSEDGEIIAQVSAAAGALCVRGSTRKGGGRALAGLIRSMRDQTGRAWSCRTVPRGPAIKVQPGVITMAKRPATRLSP